MDTQENAPQMLEDLIRKAKASGAETADALFSAGDSLSVSWRGGKIETLERSESADFGLRVLIGKKQASCSSSDCSPKGLDEIVERVVAMAKVAPEDPYCGLAAPDEIAKSFPTLELMDSFDIDAPRLIELAREMEDAALSVKGVVQCESAGAGASRSVLCFAASNGFSGRFSSTHYGMGLSALAGEGTAMEQDSDSVGVVFKEDLPPAAQIGRKAGEKTVRNLGSRKMPTCRGPVVFDPEEASGFLGTLAGAIKGSAIARGTSFLKDSLGKRIMPENITITDDPFRSRGLRSRPFDAEGLLPQKRAIVEKGVLETWILDLRSARQLGLKSTGHASRGISGVPSPSPSNFYMEAGALSVKELLSDIREGFYVTETMGMGIDSVTGDYSLAARGFWIEKGFIAFPVNEMTIAGNLKEMFLNLSAANDLSFRYGLDSPTLRIDGMTIAGI